MRLEAVFNAPFAEQVAFFRQKLALPSDRWDDIQRQAHDRAFIVAGAAKADLLDDLQQAVFSRMADGKGLEAFRRDFRRIVAQRGWTGWTGEGSKAGEAWRTKVIYQTNMTTSYAAGRYQQLTDPEFLRIRPYWRYVHSDGVLHPRPLHQQWGAMRLTLPAEHEFWKTHFPPNGWGCQCRVVPVAAPDGEDASEPPEGWAARDAKTGAPVGIDRGFDYAPGANRDTSLRELVAEKLIKYPPAIAMALTRDVNRWVDARTDVVAFATEALESRTFIKDLWLGFAEPERFAGVVDDDLRGYLVLLRADGVRHTEKSHRFDGGNQRPVTATDYADAARWLAEGEIKKGQTVSRHQRVVVTWPGDGKVIESVWEIRPGRRNRALTFISMWVKPQ